MARRIKKLDLFTTARDEGRVIYSLRVVVDYRWAPEWMAVSKTDHPDGARFQWWDGEGGQERVRFADAEAIRSAFFGVASEAEAEAFLRACGPFRSDAIEVTWSNFQKWQLFFKKQMRLGPAREGWGGPPEYQDPQVLDRIVRVPKFEPLNSPKGGNPILAARADSAVECIAALNYVDRWSNAVPSACRHCSDPFNPSTKAGIFCSNRCAQAHWRANGSSGERKGGRSAKAAK